MACTAINDANDDMAAAWQRWQRHGSAGNGDWRRWHGVAAAAALAWHGAGVALLPRVIICNQWRHENGVGGILMNENVFVVLSASMASSAIFVGGGQPSWRRGGGGVAISPAAAAAACIGMAAGMAAAA